MIISELEIHRTLYDNGYSKNIIDDIRSFEKENRTDSDVLRTAHPVIKGILESDSLSMNNYILFYKVNL